MGSMAVNQQNMPQMMASVTEHSLYNPSSNTSTAMGLGASQFQLGGLGIGNQNGMLNVMSPARGDYIARTIDRGQVQQTFQQTEENKMADPKRRLVKVIIVDPDDKVPLDKCILYSGEEKLTDLTDQELFFEIEIKTILEKHNAERIKIIDKTVKERKEHLEPVKVRDLRMVVVTVASF
jgi:hypothetical protein